MSGWRLGRCLVAAACLTVATAGCSGIHPFTSDAVSLTCPASAGGAVTLVVGARANSPQPQLPDEIKGLVTEAAKQSAAVQVVRVDGAPSVALKATFATKGKNDEIRQHDLDTFVAQTLAVVNGLTPKQPEADVLTALTTAAHATPDGGTIVLADSGIATKGQLSFRDGDMFGVDPDEAIKYLQDQHLLPNLAGRSVVLVGVGNTADPQPALDENLHNRVIGLWHDVAAKAGASCVQDLDSAQGRTSIHTDIPVSVVALPTPPAFKPCGTTILADSDTVGFVPNQAVFRDPAAAKATLKGLADELVQGHQVVTLTGTTASWGPVPSRVELSHQRADAVRDVLVSLGTDATRITTVGAGSNGPNHINDLGAGGSLLPGPAAHNRSVVVDLACPTS